MPALQHTRECALDQQACDEACFAHCYTTDPSSPHDYTSVQRRKHPANIEDDLRFTLENQNTEPRTTFWKCKKPQR